MNKDNLIVGDYITGSHAGIHKILKIYEKEGGTYVLTKQVLTSNFAKPRNNKTYEGVIDCCRRVTKDMLRAQLDDIICKYNYAIQVLFK